MIDLKKLDEIIVGYKASFKNHWKNEKFKWEAIKQFQDNWDIEAENFAEMFKLATAKTSILLASGYAYPRSMMIKFAEADGETVRAMFRRLFDETTDLAQRITEFQTSSEIVRAAYDDGIHRQHFQRTDAITTYLWLMYPDKYYIYKYELLKNVSKILCSDYKPKANGSVDTAIAGFGMYEEICKIVKQDNELRALLDEMLSESCYPDPEMKTITIDVGFYIFRYYQDELKKQQEEAQNEAASDNDTTKTEASDEQADAFPKFTKEDFLKTVYMTAERYDVLEALLRNKKNIILQGAPGVGKTFTAKRLAYAMMGEKDDSRIEFIQFHQNYSYEDFVMGYRPDGADFKLTDGIFYRFCQKAASCPEKEYFFIIDEINRGNMSKIFGELLMLIEKDYRGTQATLAYSGMPFSVSENLYIIGMMNTADRSLAMIDYALRRRFGFFEIEPGFSTEGFSHYQSNFANEIFDSLINQIKLLNKEIVDDKSLGKGFCIGHSYFCGRQSNECTSDWMRSVVEFDIIPMLSEYWFDDPAKLQRWENNLRGVFDD